MVSAKQKAFSLIEMLIVIILLGTLAATASVLLSVAVKSWSSAKDATTIAQSADLSFARLSRDLHAAKAIMTTSTTDELVFTDEADQTVDYEMANGVLLRNGIPLCNHLVNLQLNYFDNAGSAITEMQQAPNIQFVRIMLDYSFSSTLTSPNNRYQLTLFLRNHA